MILTFHTFWCNKKPEAYLVLPPLKMSHITMNTKTSFHVYAWVHQLNESDYKRKRKCLDFIDATLVQKDGNKKDHKIAKRSHGVNDHSLHLTRRGWLDYALPTLNHGVGESLAAVGPRAHDLRRSLSKGVGRKKMCEWTYEVVWRMQMMRVENES